MGEFAEQFSRRLAELFERPHRWSFRFYAKAVGPTGAYEAGETKWFHQSRMVLFRVAYGARNADDRMVPYEEDANAVAEHTRLVQQLAADGWEPTGKRIGGWWNDQFRRVAR